MKRVSIFVIVLSAIHFTESVKDLGEVSCAATFVDCPSNDTCKGYCKDACAKNDINIWGTAFFPFYSPICKSAAHDLRISVWNISERTFLAKRTNFKTLFFGSIHQRITSKSHDLSPALVSSYVFLNPQISENILDIISIHSNYLFEENENHIQDCFVASNRFDLRFNTYYGKSNGILMANKSKFGDFKRVKVLWPGHSNDAMEKERKINAGFQCIPVNNTLSILTSIAFRKDAYFLPTNLTVTVNANETVTLSMFEQVHKDYETVWKRDGKKLRYFKPQNISRTSITFTNTTMGLSGIYSLEYKDSDFQRRGNIRLIVRACPSKKYGNFCAKECPQCLNGGLCHDITGNCICPPGFSGSNCEKACEVGSVGRDCSVKCNPNFMPRDQSCKGLLICMPDPYGCSCGAGYFGLFCNETCPPGTYGAGCNQKRICHCANGESCNIFSGDCNGNCSNGWHGKFCNEIPMNITNLYYSSTPSAINLTWDQPIDAFSTVQYFIVTYKQIGWEMPCSIPINGTVIEKNSTKDYILFKHLQPSSVYAMSVRAVTVTTGWPLQIIVKTAATAPSTPTSFHVSYQTTSDLALHWYAPFPSNGLLDYYEVTYRNMENNDTAKIVIRNSKGECDRPYDSQCCVIKHLKENQEYEIQLKAFNVNVSESSTPIKIKVGTSLSDTGAEVGLSILEQNSQKVNLHIFNKYKNMDFTRRFYVVVDLSNKNHSASDIYKLIYGKADCSKLTADIYIAGMLLNIPDAGVNFTIGNKSCLNGFSNPPLQYKKTYRFGLVPLFSQCGEKLFGTIVYTPKITIIGATTLSRSGNKVGIALGFLLPLAVLIGIGILFLYLQKSKYFEGFSLKTRFFPAKAESEFAACNEALDEFDVIETESICEDLSNCLLVKELSEFVKLNAKNNKIRKEFMNLPKGQMYPCFAAKMPENKCKNRYGNILPYDHSRVILKVDGDSKYIHANYVDGYKKTRKFIATQGPLIFTMREFWSMVWQEKVSKIIMITNTMENGKCKCEKYWTDDENSYGTMELVFKSCENYADFLIRTFNLLKGNESREIKHFHFTSWPDHSVPLNTTPFLNFLKKVQVNSNCDEPILVHCSAGIGRTGAVILFENSFDMGSQEGQVDVVGQLCNMRKQRMNIVENYDQYSFVYHALVEALCTESTSIFLPDFIKEYAELQILDVKTGLTTIEKQFQMLIDLPAHSVAGDILSAYMVDNQPKNRSMHILPSDRARPILKMQSSYSDYINAVYIDGYRSRNMFIATQYPLPETVIDFWRMVYEERSKIIVILQDIPFCETKTPQFWPLQGSQTSEMFHIECESLNEEKDVLIYNLKVKQKDSMEELSLRLVQVKCWSVDGNLPSDYSELISVMQMLQLWDLDFTNNSIITCCFDGMTACGVFCAFLYIVDRMKSEKEIDIFQTTKCIRTNRPQFITNVDQYTLLFDLTKDYLEHKDYDEND